MPEVADDRVDEEELAVLGPVHAPGVGGPTADDLEGSPGRMEPPDGAIQGDPLLGRSTRRPNARRGLNSMAAVEPAIGTPAQAVRHVVAHRVGVPAVEHDLGHSVGHVVAVAIGQEQQPGRAQRPDAAETHFHAAEPLGLVPEDCTAIGRAVVVVVAQDHNPVMPREVEIDGALGVRLILGDPEPPPGVGRQGDGLGDHGLGGEERGREPFRERQRGQGRGWCRRSLRSVSAIRSGRVGRRGVSGEQTEKRRPRPSGYRFERLHDRLGPQPWGTRAGNLRTNPPR